MQNIIYADNSSKDEAEQILEFARSLNIQEQLQLLAFLQGYKMGQLNKG